MKKGKPVIDLYGEHFTEVKGQGVPTMRYDDITSAYGRPSDRKIAIWNYWKRWFRDVLSDNNGGDIYVTSRNTNFFTIGGFIDSPNGERWGFYITSTRQECWKVCDI